MSILSGVSAFFGLDIGTTAIRVVELQGNGQTKSLVNYGYAPVDSKIVMSDSKTDQQRLAQAISELLEKSRISTRNVAVGIPSQRVFTTLADFDRLPKDEMAKSIQYQADSLIPTPLDESKLDWAVVGDSPKEDDKLEVLLSSVPNNYIEQRLDMLEDIGLNVIAFEPDNLAMARAMLPISTTAPQLALDVGFKTADLVIFQNGSPKLTRSIPTGIEAIVRSAAQNLNVDEKQAQQFVFKFGLSKDKLEGNVYQGILPTVDLLTNEVEKSIKFFKTRYGDSPIERLVVTGGAAALPEFPLHIANRFNLNVEIGNAWRNVAFSPKRQNELLALANQFGVAVGLAERQE